MTRSNSAAKPNFGVQTPRIEWVPPGKPHPDQEAVLEFADAADFTLQEWQNRVLAGTLLEKRRGKWASFDNCCVVPRQNGKTELAIARMLGGALVLDERLIIYTAHLAKTSDEVFLRLRKKIDEIDWIRREVKHIWRSNGREVVEFNNGSRILCQTRTPSSARGFAAVDCLILDEAMYLQSSEMASVLYVVGRAKNPQLWYLGSAPNQFTQPDSVAFAALRVRALEGGDPSLYFAEWSMPYDHPDAVPVDALTDPALIAIANPAYGFGLPFEQVENEYRSARHDIKSYIIERLGVGDWPAVDAEATVIDMDRWAELGDPGGAIQGAGVFALAVSPDRAWASIAVGGERADGARQVEIVEHKRGTAWVVPWLEQRRSKVILDARGPAGSLEPALVAAGVEVEPVTTGEHCRACAVFFDAVAEGTVRHLNDTLLTSALGSAQRRPVGDSWLWARTITGPDLTPLEAATLALWGASTAGKPQFVGVAFA